MNCADDAGKPERRVIFISHANPEDNDFTRWLGSRLTMAGYEVWTDLTRLIGGEEFWKDIEVALRQHTAKHIFVLSRMSVTKSGLRNELAIGDAVAKKFSQPSFLLPIRIDDLPHGELPAQLMQKNVIDFSQNWASGLERLLKTLDRDQVPRKPGDLADAARAWVLAQTESGQTLRKDAEILQSNWLQIHRLPRHVCFYEIKRPIQGFREVQHLAAQVSWPSAGYMRYIVGFGSLSDMQHGLPDQTPLALHSCIKLESFLQGQPNGSPPIEKPEARRLAVNLIRQAWDRAMRGKGLLPFQLSDKATAWWIPQGLLPKDISRFTRFDGKSGWRQLVGRDNTRGLYWHFGARAVVLLGRPRRILLRPHVIFSRDGQTGLGSKWRRAACKMWFNAKWRDLIAGFSAFLTDGAETISLQGGENIRIELNPKPLLMRAPVSLALDAPAAPIPSEEGDEDDFDGIDRANDPAFYNVDDMDDEDETETNVDGDEEP